MERARPFNPSASGSKPPGSSIPVWTEQYYQETHNGREGAWVIPTSCPCCNKCWLITDPRGQPLIFSDTIGRQRTRCIHGGPYKGYVEIPDGPLASTGRAQDS